MPGPIIDCHAHYVRFPTGEAGQRARQTATHAPGALPDEGVEVDDLLSSMDEAGVDKLVQVTPTAMAYDNEYSLAGAHAHPDRIRVTGRLDPATPDLDAQVATWAADPHLVAIRVLEFPMDGPWLTDGRLDRLWAAAERADLPVSVYAPGRAKPLGEIARRHPDLRLIVDHCTVHILPLVPLDQRFESWQDFLALASLPNVWVKVSGLPEATDEPFPFPHAQQRLAQACEAFGVERLMWASNYPPAARVCTYRETLDFVREGCDFLDPDERDQLLGGVATRVLGLPW